MGWSLSGGLEYMDLLVDGPLRPGCALDAFAHAAHIDEQNLLSGFGDETQAGPNDFGHRRNKSIGFFVMNTGTDGAALYGFNGSHEFVFYSEVLTAHQRRKWIWSRSWILQIQYSLLMNTYRMKVLDDVANVTCART